MKVYVLLYWFWEGDSYLVDSFVDVKRSMDEIMNVLKENNRNLYKYYLPGEEIPKEESGHFGVDGFYQIIEREV